MYLDNGLKLTNFSCKTSELYKKVGQEFLSYDFFQSALFDGASEEVTSDQIVTALERVKGGLHKRLQDILGGVPPAPQVDPKSNVSVKALTDMLPKVKSEKNLTLRETASLLGVSSQEKGANLSMTRMLATLGWVCGIGNRVVATKFGEDSGYTLMQRDRKGYTVVHITPKGVQKLIQELDLRGASTKAWGDPLKYRRLK